MKNTIKTLGFAFIVAIALSYVLTVCDTGGGNTDPLDLAGDITISPTTAIVGAVLTANYSGKEKVSYQWNKDGSALAGKTETTLTADMAGSYTVTVSASGYNGKMSTAVVVSEGTPPPETFTVTFNTNGGSPTPPNQTIEKGKTVAEPSAITKNNDTAGLYVGIPGNYTFSGWYYNGTKWDFNTLVTEDITLTAQWTSPSAIPIDIPNSYTGSILERAFNYAVANKTNPEGFTLLLDDDVVSGGIFGNSSFTFNMTLIGIGKPRIITRIKTDNGPNNVLFNIYNSSLTLGANITLKSVPNYDYDLISVGSNGKLTMLTGSKITDCYLAIDIERQNSQFNMEGGEITNCQYGIYNCTKFTMSGGKIIGNNIVDVGICDEPIWDTSSILSGSSQIGILAFLANNDNNPVITISSGWSGTVSNFSLWGEYNDDLNTTISWWQNKVIIKAVDGYIITLSDIGKFQLGNFVTNTTPEITQPINNTNKFELDTTNNIVKLVAK